MEKMSKKFAAFVTGTTTLKMARNLEKISRMAGQQPQGVTNM
jgi:hypothetical protein